MADFNLTNQQIKDTYEQLAQIGTSSLLLDGTGSIVSSLSITASHATFAESATNATNADNIALSSDSTNANRRVTFTATDNGDGTLLTDTGLLYNPSTNLLTVSSVQANLIGNATSATSASYAPTILPSGTVSSSAQLPQIGINQTDIASLTAQTSSYLTSVPSGTVSSSAQTIANIAGGTIAPSTINVDTANILSASIGYLESITGSAKIIGDAYIVLNNNTPTERYAGIVVQDSGSTNNTASFEFDGQTNDWFYEYTDDGGATAEFGAVMFGPGYNTRGSHVYPSNNTILKGTGDHHIVDSIITDDGSTVTVGGDIEGNVVTANTYFAGDLIGTASLADTASYVSAGNVDGTVANATTASYALTSSAATTFTISTQLDLGSSVITVDSASATGSLIDNIHPAIASGSTAIKHIVTIDQTAYDTISGSGAVSDDTFYIIEDAGDNVYPGNLQVQGQIYSPTFAGTIASSTSSIDFDNGNFATLNCATSTFLANPTNLQGGTTYTLIVTNGANISGYGTAWKFAGGTEPTLSANTDVITAVSDGTSLYAAALADFS